MRAHVTGAIATATGLLAGIAHADDALPPPLRLEVQAPCTDGVDFGRRLQARSSRLQLGSGPDAIGVAVTIHPAATGELIEGTMHVGDSVRQVEGGTCEEVAEALSLVAVLMFDPEAETRPSPAAPAPAPPPPPPAPEQPRPAVRSPVGPAPAREEDWRWALGMHGVGAAIDEFAIGASVLGEMARGRNLSTLTFRVALTTYGARVELGPRAASLLWSFLAPQVCPLRVRAGLFSVFPCAGVAMGVLSSEPIRGVERPKSFTRLWFATRGAARARVGLSSRLGLELEAALDVPVIRERYAFGDVEAYRVPALIPSLGIGIAMELP